MGDEITDYLASTSALSATATNNFLKLKPGLSIGAYRVLAFLGRGACGEVWKVHDDSLNCDLALKLFSPKEPQSEDETTRLRRHFIMEARCLAQFRHPNIVRVHALSANGDAPYFTMDFLHPLVRPIPRRMVRRIVGGVLSALDELHSKGVVHRDVKPSNVLLDDGGNVVLADFGVAQIDDGQTTAKVRPDDGSTATLSGVPAHIAGTPAFGAPEQFVGEPATSASDLHAVGRLALWLFDDAPPLSWRWFILCATNSSPDLRYHTAKSMQRALSAMKVLERVFAAIVALVAACVVGLCAALLKSPEPLDLFEFADIANTNIVCRYDFLGTSEMQTGRVVTLRDGREYKTDILHGRLMLATTGYDDKLQSRTVRQVREPIVIRGRGTLLADTVAFADVHLMPGVTLVTSGEYPNFTRRIPYGDPMKPRSRYEPYPIHPPPDSSVTNEDHTIYTSYTVEKGAKLIFTGNNKYPESLIERK